ncbi:hypothetical protein K474DRAFT_1092117 [Panus rudis PR-1116 ss-1]|nr:hypothetical protein K474DRAFT_1092117 [Panus rudis PR-1116 ss-1]
MEVTDALVSCEPPILARWSAIYLVQDAIKKAVGVVLPAEQCATLCGTSNAALGAALLLKLVQLQTPSPPTVNLSEDNQEGVSQCEIPEILSIFSNSAHGASFRITYKNAAGRDSNATGTGVHRAIITSACAAMLKNHNYWHAPSKASGGYYLPLFLDGEPSVVRTAHWKAYGALIAVSLVYVTSTPVSPFLVMALLAHEKQLAVTKEIIALFQPVHATELAPWLDLDPTKAIPTAHTDKAVQFLYALGLQPSIVQSSCTNEREFRQRTSIFLSQQLLGYSNLWKNEEFLALLAGFNQTIGDTTFVEIFQNHAKTNTEVAQYIGAMYNRKVKSPDEVIQLLEATDREDDAQSVTNVMLDELFLRRVKRYLQGCGHPDHPIVRKTVPQEYFRQRRKDPLFRSRLLLTVMSDSDLLPADPDQRILFTFAEPDTSIAADAEPLFKVHTCIWNIIVEMRPSVLRLIGKSEPDLHKATDFDSWFHSSLLSCVQSFNYY